MNQDFDILIVGGGAAGFFSAINIVERNPKLKVAILERGKEVLSKVRVSGGGRCNVTHACFEPNELVKYYPRGEKELRGPFHQFCSGDTIEWFEKHGVELKIEDDGRMFPVSNSSQTIIDCFLTASHKLGITILTGQSVQSIFKKDNCWKIETQTDNYLAEKLILATGSNPKIWDMLHTYGHAIVTPVPSLFTFNIKDPRIKELPGIATQVNVKVIGSKLESTGPLGFVHQHGGRIARHGAGQQHALALAARQLAQHALAPIPGLCGLEGGFHHLGVLVGGRAQPTLVWQAAQHGHIPHAQIHRAGFTLPQP